jgi:hypothetical protein
VVDGDHDVISAAVVVAAAVVAVAIMAVAGVAVVAGRSSGRSS